MVIILYMRNAMTAKTQKSFGNIVVGLNFWKAELGDLPPKLVFRKDETDSQQWNTEKLINNKGDKRMSQFTEVASAGAVYGVI